MTKRRHHPSSDHNACLPRLRSPRLTHTNYTRHGALRKQQRGVPAPAIEFLQDWGIARHCGGGREKYYFNSRTWERFSRANPQDAKRFAKMRNMYVVIGDDGSLVTVAHRTKAVRKDI